MEEIAHPYSLETLKKTFNIKTLDEVTTVNISMDPNKYIPSGSPGIVLKESLFSREGMFVPVLFPFPARAGLAPEVYTEIYNKNLYPIPQKNLLTKHTIKTIDMFYIKKIKHIKEYVKTDGAITFILNDLSNAKEFFINIPLLCSSAYKYEAFFHHYTGQSNIVRSNENKFMVFVSFIDINYCIPIFDHRKVDGMGVYCGFMCKNIKTNNNILIDALTFVLSNYKDNLFYLDGSNVSVPTKINKDVLLYMVQHIVNEMKYLKDKNLKGVIDKNEMKHLKDKNLKEIIDKPVKKDIKSPELDYFQYSTTSYSTSSTSTWH